MQELEPTDEELLAMPRRVLTDAEWEMFGFNGRRKPRPLVRDDMPEEIAVPELQSAIYDPGPYQARWAALRNDLTALRQRIAQLEAHIAGLQPRTISMQLQEPAS